MTVADAALVLDVIAGKDQLDSTTIDRQDNYTQLEGSLKGQKIGVVKEYMQNLNPDLQKLLTKKIDWLKAEGAQVTEVSLPSLKLALACYYIICPAEISSNLSRYDGQHFGYHAKEAKNLEESFSLTRSQGFGREAKRRIMIGTYVLSSGFYDAYYKKAQQLRTKLIKEFEQTFNSVDFLLGPTAPTHAFKLGENAKDPLHMYMTDIMTVAANLVGIPAISLPLGKIGKLPVGWQLMAPQKHDKQLLTVAAATEGGKDA
jgi:aspartyl-tRNA(Asn)/glutamyl-tRNA(Gln) amidotransferase subunit A